MAMFVGLERLVFLSRLSLCKETVADLSPHFLKQISHQMVPKDLNIAAEIRVWRLDSGPNLQPLLVIF